MKYLISLAAILLFQSPAIAQSASILDTSRALRAETREAAGQGDWEAARRTNAAALALQPGHPGLLNNALLIARFGEDERGQIEALQAIARAGLAFDLDGLEGLEALQRSHADALDQIRAQLAQNTNPVGTARPVASPSLANALIEALEIDSETERVYLGGVAQRRIYRTDPYDPTVAEVMTGEDEAIGSIFGLAVDRRRGRLYAAEGVIDGVTPVNEGETLGTSVLELDLETGDVLERHTLEGAARIGDVFVRDSIVYASDAEGGRIYRLEPGEPMEVFAEDPRFASLQGVISARGAVFVADYALGLWRIDPVTRQASLMRPPQGASLIGLDGLAVDRAGRVFVVRNGAAPYGVFELEFDRNSELSALTPILLGDERLGEPVTVRLTDGRAFLINDAQWRYFEGEDADAEARTDPIILSVELD